MRTGQVIASAQEEIAAARSARKRRFVFVVALAILIAASSVVGKKSLVKVFQMNKTTNELQREIARLRQINEDLARELQAFTHNPSQVEAIAREDLGLVKPGEIVYQFGPPRPTTAPPVSPR
ncbi:septum formation initiator family protein [Candidatus Methylomirabilis sp.]|uniref:FtsB family cell division protein n=1 Tax=Candidatus Methylomirabilis sp. TaxID=2032687 RepID=UPI002A657396|nr:septum formation initiator family protein [Candidatus Methylomirabilis sp.]